MKAARTLFPIEERVAWRNWVTPKLLRQKPIHSWYTFPHSFTSELVHGLISEWGLSKNDFILDPFAGAGTTILTAKEGGIPATGYDLSPLAVLVTKVKIAKYDLGKLRRAWAELSLSAQSREWSGAEKSYPKLVEKALPGRLLGAFESLANAVRSLSCSETEKDFFRLALLATVPRYSRAVVTGGWLKWIDRRTNVRSLGSAFRNRVHAMLADLEKDKLSRETHWHMHEADARRLPDSASKYSAVITSPPYPNRHDYTRVFGVELMLEFLDWEETRQLRYQSFHSHPEARPVRPASRDYECPKALAKTLARLREKGLERKILGMLAGYFLDMHLCLAEINRVCRKGASVGLVLGNAQYCGEELAVDEMTAEIGESAGLVCRNIIAVRYRGNSAQQMGAYGRNPSRESIVVFTT